MRTEKENEFLETLKEFIGIMIKINDLNSRKKENACIHEKKPEYNEETGQLISEGRFPCYYDVHKTYKEWCVSCKKYDEINRMIKRLHSKKRRILDKAIRLYAEHFQ